MSDHAIENARGQLRSILEHVEAIRAAEEAGDDRAREEAEERAREEALSVEVRAEDWSAPGEKLAPDTFRVLLTTGGPACHLIGRLDAHGEPERDGIRIEWQDWFKPWTELPLMALEEHAHENAADILNARKDALHRFASLFYYGEGA